MSKVVLTNSFRGGTGKSTIISNIASYLATLGSKVIIIDGDIISPGIHAIFGLSEKNFSKTLTDYLLGKADITDAVYDVSGNIGVGEGSLLLVPSSIASSDIVTLIQQTGNSEKIEKGLKKLNDKLNPDYILVDTHPGLNDPFLVATSFSDIILNILRPDNQDYQGAQVSAEVSRKMKVKMYLVLNKVHKKLGKKRLIKDVESAFGLPVAGALPFSEDILASESQFVFIEKYPKHKFSEGIGDIVGNVFGVKPKEHLEVMHDLLGHIMEHKKSTIEHIATTKNIPHQKCVQYIRKLDKDGFIKIIKDKGKEFVELTSKGDKFLKKYKTIKRFADDFRL